MTSRLGLPVIFCALSAASCATAINDVHPAAHPTARSGVVLATYAESSGDALSLDVSPHVMTAPGRASVQARIEPDARSRSLTIEWWTTDGVGGSHEIGLEGESAPTRHEYSIKHLSPGDYIVSVVLTRNDGSHIKRDTTVRVVGEGTRVDATELVRPASGRVGPGVLRIPWADGE